MTGPPDSSMACPSISSGDHLSSVTKTPLAAPRTASTPRNSGSRNHRRSFPSGWWGDTAANREIGVSRLALRAAGASRTYHRAFPAATGLSGTSGALDPLDGGSYPTDSCIGRRAYPPHLLAYSSIPDYPALSPALLGAQEDRGGSHSRGVL